MDELRPGIAQYAGFFPRYNRLMAESGFEAAAQEIADAWAAGDAAAAARAVPDAFIDATSIVGTASQCRERIEAYREAGLDLPIIGPRTTSVADFERALRACAPGS